MKFSAAAFTSLYLIAYAAAQQVGTLTAEQHPKLSWQKCSKSGGCATQSASVVLDANWRWLHSTSGATNCYDGNAWNKSLCPDNVSCAKNCAVDGEFDTLCSLFDMVILTLFRCRLLRNLRYYQHWHCPHPQVCPEGPLLDQRRLPCLPHEHCRH